LILAVEKLPMFVFNVEIILVDTFDIATTSLVTNREDKNIVDTAWLFAFKVETVRVDTN
jgi:hypothetical protein